MLKKEIKRSIYFIILLSLFSACESAVDSSNKENLKLNYAKKANKYVNENFHTYQSIYNILKDSIETYKKAELRSFLNIYDNYWIMDSVKYLEIDSMLCINSERNKLVATMNFSLNTCNDCKMDAITKLLGKKINNKWYFFCSGETLVVPRNYYGKDAMHPLTFYELSQIARKELLESILVKNASGEYVVNDKWIDSHFYKNLFGGYKTKEEYDSVHWFMILQKWKSRIDTNKYKPFRRKIETKPAV